MCSSVTTRRMSFGGGTRLLPDSKSSLMAMEENRDQWRAVSYAATCSGGVLKNSRTRW